MSNNPINIDTVDKKGSTTHVCGVGRCDEYMIDDFDASLNIRSDYCKKNAPQLCTRQRTLDS